MSIVSLSANDIFYPLTPNTSFHPSNLDAAAKRIEQDFRYQLRYTSDTFQNKVCKILLEVIKSKKAANTWTIIFEFRQQPFYVVRNLSFKNRSLGVKNVLLVILDRFLYPPNDAAFSELRTLNQVDNNQLNEECDPLISMMSEL